MPLYHPVLHTKEVDIEGKKNILLLLFNHDVLNTTNERPYFSSVKETLYSMDVYKYSILGLLDESLQVAGKFEFFMYFPEYETYGHWTQTINPVNAEYNQEIDYQPLSSTWQPEIKFGGLTKYIYPNLTFIDGSPDSDFFFSIGQRDEWAGTKSIPGYKKGFDTIHILSLWVKISSYTQLSHIIRKCVVTCGMKSNLSYLHFSILSFIFVEFSW